MKNHLGIIIFLTTLLMAQIQTNNQFYKEGSQIPNYQHARFSAGCFWCTQPLFDQTPGVVSVKVGYTGGTISNPSYEQVSTGQTGHRESIDIIYDPSKISYEQLLDVFWTSIDPTDNGGQFVDRGPQYTTAIYYFNEDQNKKAEASKNIIAKKFAPKTIATEILPAVIFYPAEDYHQQFYRKSPMRYELYKAGSGHEEKLKKIWKH